MYMSQSKENQQIGLNKPLTLEVDLNYQKFFQETIFQTSSSETKLEQFKKFEQWLDRVDKKKKEEVLTHLTSILSKSDTEVHWPIILELWLKYAELQPDPLITFNTMLQQNIGVRQELFYTKWGVFFEQRKNFKQAEDIYRLGQERLGSGGWETLIERVQSMKETDKPEVKRQFGMVLSQTKKDSTNRLKRTVKPSEITPEETSQQTGDEITPKDSSNATTESINNEDIQPSIQPSSITTPQKEPSPEIVTNINIDVTVPQEEPPIEENGDFNIFEDPEGTTDKCTEIVIVTPQKPSPSGKDYTLLDNQENKPPEGLTLPRQASGDNIESQRVFRQLYYTTLDPSEGNNC